MADEKKELTQKDVLERQAKLKEDILALLEGDDSAEAASLRASIDQLDEHELMNTYSALKQKKESTPPTPE